MLSVDSRRRVWSRILPIALILSSLADYLYITFFIQTLVIGTLFLLAIPIVTMSQMAFTKDLYVLGNKVYYFGTNLNEVKKYKKTSSGEILIYLDNGHIIPAVDAEFSISTVLEKISVEKIVE
ncbi:hypothetical protein AB6A23_00880 [Paenibacillus tarimensis]